jgi:hypothetical protein
MAGSGEPRPARPPPRGPRQHWGTPPERRRARQHRRARRPPGGLRPASEQLGDVPAQNRLAQRRWIGLDGADGFHGERRDQPGIGPEIARSQRQLPGEQSARLDAQAVVRVQTALDLVAERTLQRDAGKRHSQARRVQYPFRRYAIDALDDDGAQAIRPRQRLEHARRRIDPERPGNQPHVTDLRPRLRQLRLPEHLGEIRLARRAQ